MARATMAPAFPNGIYEEISDVEGKVLILAKDWFPPGVILNIYANFFVVGRFSAYGNGEDYRVEGKKTIGMVAKREDAEYLYSKETLPAKKRY